MRLTLRTLLSWKDGMLDQEAARDLAARIEASDKAAQIVAKITETVGRPTLSAAPPDAGDFATAAGTTAEYLDNVLSAEQLERFERLCLASDAQLAEAAACHEILAAWSREAAGPLDRKARRRLLAAVQARVPAAESAPAPKPRAAPRVRRPAAVETRASRPPVGAWLLVAAAALLLVALFGVLGWSLARRGSKAVAAADVAVRGGEPAAAQAAGEPAAAVPTTATDAPPAAAVPPAAPVTPAAATPPPTAPADVANPTPDAALAEPAVPDDDAVVAAPPPPPMPAAPAAPDAAVAAGAGAPADRPPAPPAAAAPAGGSGLGVESPPSLAAGPRVTSGDAIAIAAPAAPPAAAALPAGPAADTPPAAASARVAGSAVLLHRPPGSDIEAWVAATDGTALDLPVDLVAPPFGRPALTVDRLRITFEPGTRAVLARDADGTPRLTVVFGAASAVGGERLAVTAGDLAGTIVDGLAAPVGVEVGLRRDPGAEADAAVRAARVLPSVGAIAWRGPAPDGGEATAVRVGTALAWRSTAPATSALEPAAGVPDWLTGRRAADAVDSYAAGELGKRLAAGTAAAPALRDLAADRRVEGRIAAAATLALVGEFSAVAQLISAEGPAALPESLWSRLDAAAVQPALARGPLAAGGLAQALSEQAPPGAADRILRFARGFTDDELAAGAAAELVAALESPHLAVRRYAIKNLVEITGVDSADRLRYRADRPAAALREGVAWWRTQLDQGRIVRAAAAGVPR